MQTDIATFLCVIDASLLPVYNLVLGLVNNKEITLSNKKTISNPLNGYCWASINYMEECLSYSRKSIISKLKSLEEMGFIKSYKLKDLKLRNPIVQYNRQLTKLKTLLEIPENERDKVKQIPLLHLLNQTFRKANTNSINNLNIKIQLYKQVRHSIRKIKKTADVPNQIVLDILNGKFDGLFHNQKWTEVNEKIKSYFEENKSFLHSIPEFNSTTFKSKIIFTENEKRNFKFMRDINTSQLILKDKYANQKTILLGIKKLTLPSLNGDSDYIPICQEFSTYYSLEELFHNINPNLQLLYLFLEWHSINIPIDKIKFSWAMFKTRNPNWRKYSLNRIIRSLRLFVYYETEENSTPVEQTSKSSDWYYITPRQEGTKLSIPAPYRKHVDVDDFYKLKFFTQNTYRFTETGRPISPFYVPSNNLELAMAGKQWIYPWTEIIEKHGGDEKEILLSLYKKVQPVIEDLIEYQIEMGHIKERPIFNW